MGLVSRLAVATLPLVVLGCAPFAAADGPATGGEGDGGEGGADAGSDAERKDGAAPPTSTLGNGLIARWRFDEMSGTSAVNDVQPAPPGAVSGAMWTTGKLGGALSFNGTSSSVTVPPSAGISVSDALTLALWANLDASPSTTDQRFVAHAPIDFKLNRRSPQIGTGNGNAATFYELPIGEWHHIAATVARGVPHVYIDGLDSSSFKVNTMQNLPVAPQTRPLYIGTYGDGNGFANGRLDDVRMWNRALTPSEVLELSKER